MIKISVKADIKKLQRQLDDIAKKQVPFATAQALTAVAKIVQKAEKQNLHKVFDRPTPFTERSIRMQAARKSNLQATVFVQDIAAGYLQPFEDGGLHKLIGKGNTWFNPKYKTLLNKYGNLSRTKVAQLKRRPGVFIGKVKTKREGEMSGVFQRIPATSTSKAGLKILLRFGDAIPVKQHLNFGTLGRKVVAKNIEGAFRKALSKAIATAR